MFFELHNENKIGYKILSSADLGTGDSSHQTHIGLSEHVLTFLSDRDEISEDSIFIHDSNFEYIDAYFDRIENPDGSFRSPKIRIGERACVSVVSTIREIVHANNTASEWYLIWFGLKNDKTVFFLFDNLSVDYQNIVRDGLSLDKKGAKALDISNPVFQKLVEYLENKVNANGVEILKELEVSSQVQEWKPNKRFKKYDIDMANQKFQEIGKTGEQLIAKYLQNKLSRGLITSYDWHNKDEESGLPYDFTIQDNRANICYLDVKTTGYNFNQKMIFSSQEIDFISNVATNYAIYRVYRSNEDQYLLRICDDCKNLSSGIWEKTLRFSAELDTIQVELKGAKMAVSPEIPSLRFNSSIDIAVS